MRDSTSNAPPARWSLLSVFDRPLRKDWIFWLFVVSLAAPTTNAIINGDSSSPLNPVSGLIDAVFAVVVQYVFFALMPSRLRQRSRKKRALRTDLAEQEIPESNSHQLPIPPKVNDFPNELPVSNKVLFTSKRFRLLTAIALVLGVLFVHGNWEYRILLDEVEMGEAVLENYHKDAETLQGKLNLITSIDPSLRTSRYYDEVLNIVLRWQGAAGEREAQLNEIRSELSSDSIVFWNRQTRHERELIEFHYEVWAGYLRALSLDLYSDQEIARLAITESFRMYCADATRHALTLDSIFSWPSRQSAATRLRTADICDD